MSLKVIKTRLKGNNALQFATLITQLAADVSSLVPFPPATAAASAVLAILGTVQASEAVKSNRDDCFRLARRAARLLIDLGRRMEGKWENAPPALLENVREFERTLISIRDFMLGAAQVKWIDRFLQKSDIEAAILDHNSRLEEASHSFQVFFLMLSLSSRRLSRSIMKQMASLIEIQHDVWHMRSGFSIAQNAGASNIVTFPSVPPYVSEDAATYFPPPTWTPLDSSKEVAVAQHTKATTEVVAIADSSSTENSNAARTAQTLATEVEAFLGESTEACDEFGFRRYHQSEVILRKSNRRGQGWFAGIAEVDVNGQKMMAKRYDEPTKTAAVRRWMNDIKMLRTIYHENLPQILGYSDGKTPTPFILMAQVQINDVHAYVQSALKTQTLASSASTMLRMYRDITSAALHLKQQLSLNNGELQDFVEVRGSLVPGIHDLTSQQNASFSISEDKNIVLGLPPPKEGTWLSFRSYSLTETLVDYPESHPTSSNNLTVQKIQQLRALLEALLPKANHDPNLHPSLEELLEDVGHRLNSITLSALRHNCLSRNVHSQQWTHRAPLGKNNVGDYGYIPAGGTFEEFQRLGNVVDLEPGTFSFISEVTGKQTQFLNGFIDRQDVEPFVLHDGLEGWPTAVSPRAEVTVFVIRRVYMDSVNSAWKFLLKSAQQIAESHGVDPHQLILITQTITINDHRVKDCSPPPLPMPGQRQGPAFLTNPPFNHSPSHGHSFGQFGNNQVSAPPRIVYLFTSASPDHKVFWTDNPMGKPRPREYRSTSWTYSGSSGWPTSDISYIQLHEEDFAG
ncbi:hypothetical protein HETIRDRAFT_445465 [Heterobasidion irregulare TC 32-1]|uniref:Mixed lineage kinase domain-containing protein n=1 Tax=Heterobasidion irregulare (strain TC 32-1) TaxID=747525 RepID=W4K2M6_HETIT|nr:uncharacterized protein HETIRDRAFT_445465 [Heterobasidion irregulare TC 32-1]ETW79605.1 hypothetical protein HETIRDRAFT_445465 [Heterobasidion irregulare TC 32-1]